MHLHASASCVHCVHCKLACAQCTRAQGNGCVVLPALAVAATLDIVTWRFSATYSLEESACAFYTHLCGRRHVVFHLENHNQIIRTFCTILFTFTLCLLVSHNRTEASAKQSCAIPSQSATLTSQQRKLLHYNALISTMQTEQNSQTLM